MEKYKLDKKKAITLLSCVALAATLYSCMSPKKESNSQKGNVESITQVEETTSEPKSQSTKENASNKEDNISKEYIEYLKEEINEVESYAKDKWNSEECIKKREDIKERLKTLIDFVFNGKEINGKTFKDLKTEEKEKIVLELTKLDGKIDEYIPDYKERFNDWLVEKSANAKKWLIDRSADLKEVWEDYKSDVEEEYQKRKI